MSYISQYYLHTLKSSYTYNLVLLPSCSCMCTYGHFTCARRRVTLSTETSYDQHVLLLITSYILIYVLIYVHMLLPIILSILIYDYQNWTLNLHLATKSGLVPIYMEKYMYLILSVLKKKQQKELLQLNCGYALRIAWFLQTAYFATSKSCLLVENNCSPALATGIVCTPQITCITLPHYQQSCLREPKSECQPQANQSCNELWGNQYCQEFHMLLLYYNIVDIHQTLSHLYNEESDDYDVQWLCWKIHKHKEILIEQSVAKNSLT